MIHTQIPFPQSMMPLGNVENWLSEVEIKMRESIHWQVHCCCCCCGGGGGGDIVVLVVKVSGPNLDTHFKRTPILEWCVVRCGS